MNELQNVKAVRQLLAGTHKTQTRQTHYFGKIITEVADEDIIEKFTNGKPYIWIEVDPVTNVRTRVTQNDGFKSRESEAGYLIRQSQKELLMPSDCPTCGYSMHNHEKRLNEKFWSIHKECFDCVVKKETLLRSDPEAWDSYQRQVQNADGDVETFEASMSKEKFKDMVLHKYEEYKKDTLGELKNGNR